MEREPIDSILRRKALEWLKSVGRTREVQVGELTEEEVLREVREMVKGDRGEELIENALRLYKGLAIRVFKKLVEAKRSGRIKELWDYQLYKLFESLGMRVPVSTRIRVVKHGEVKDLSELLTDGSSS